MLKFTDTLSSERPGGAPAPDREAGRARRCIALSAGIGIAAILLGLAVIAGWTFDLQTLKSVAPQWVSMKANTAIGFIFAGAALYLLSLRGRVRWAMPGAAACAAVTTTIGVLTVIQYLFHLDLGIDSLMFAKADTEYVPGRPAPITAFNFTLLGVAIILSTMRNAALKTVGQLLAVPAFTLSYLALLGYLLSASALYQIPGFVSVAFHTAVGQLLLSIGMLLALPETGITRLLIVSGQGGRLARRFVVLSILLFPALGWFRLKVEDLGLVTPEMGVAILTALILAVFLATVLLPVDALIKSEVERNKLSEAVAASKRAESTFRNVLNAAPDAMLVVDGPGQIIMANAEAEDLFGYTRDELIGQKIELLVPDRVRRHHTKHRKNFWSTPSKRPMSQSMKLAGRRKDGAEVPVEIALSPLKSDAGQQVIVSIRDISERVRFYEALDRKNVELERASKAKDHFLANMSHELRTPLTVILGFARILKMKAIGQLNDKQEHQVGKIETNAGHLLSLLNDLLDLAKIESGDADISLEPVDLPALLDEVASSMQPAAKSKGIELTVQCPQRLQLAHSSGRVIRQILENLISNGIKYTNKGSVRVVVKNEADLDQIETRIHVIDTGVGIRPEHSEKLFQPFSRLEESQEHEGTGLGLHLSRNMAKALGGTLVYESVFGLGSTFTLILVEDLNAERDRESSRSDAA